MAGGGGKGGSRKGIPQWVADEVQTAKFGRPAAVKRTGHVLDTYVADGKIDAQLDDPVEDGRHIVTMDVAPEIRIGELQRGVLYEFAIDEFKAPLSGKAAEYLRSEMGVDMNAVYKFVLREYEEAGGGGAAGDDLDE